MDFVQRPCSVDESFEYIDYPTGSSFVNSAESSDQSFEDILSPDQSDDSLHTSIDTVVRGSPLTEDDFRLLLDQDGRLVDEHALRRAVFMGGVDPKIRKEVWQFLFGLYPCTSTYREREDILLDYIMKYHELKSRWKTMLVLNAKPGATTLQQGLVARYQVEGETNKLRSPDIIDEVPLTDWELQQTNSLAAQESADKPDISILSKNFKSLDINSPEMQQKIDFVKIQAQVFVNRKMVNVRNLWKHLRVIDKDVPRTDREHEYFKGVFNPNLTVLREILVTFCAFDPEIGYAQGMNDILSRFLVVFDSEVLGFKQTRYILIPNALKHLVYYDFVMKVVSENKKKGVEAYWCFRNYLNKIQEDFTEDGMIRKIKLVVMLLKEMDSDLLEHLDQHELGDLLFCHRWLLLGFKREFTFDDSLRCFEILSSHHLELYSMEAEKARRHEQMKEFEHIGGGTKIESCDAESEYTFELFMCLALLEECRDKLLQCTDVAVVFSTINSLQIDLDDILLKSAKLFYKYCKKSVEDSFLMVESPQVKRKHRQKDSFMTANEANQGSVPKHK